MYTPSCSPCMCGRMGVMAHGEGCVSTTHSHFVRRLVYTRSLLYLSSPEVAAASAIAGYLADPRRGGG